MYTKKKCKIYVLSVLLCTFFFSCSSIDFELPQGPQGTNGKSAYEIWKEEVETGHINWPSTQVDLADFLVYIKGEKGDYDITLKDAIIIGLFQMVTIIPGISRSGTVLVACLLCHLKRDTALKYTFILYFPVSVATMILGVKDLANTAELSTLLIPYLVGMIAAGLVTYVSYKWLSNWVKQGKLWKFSIYCLLLALFIFIYFR